MKGDESSTSACIIAFFLSCMSSVLALVSLTCCSRACAMDSHEVEVLLAFKATIVADPLATLQDWDVGEHNSSAAAAAAACHWKGISCDPHSGHILAITLVQAHIQGSIAPQLGALPALTHLNLSYNNFTGPIPSSLGNLTSLLLLDLSNNYLNTTIPSSLGDLLSVQYLWLHKNLLQGSIPATIGNCTSLESFSLAYNFLGGVIPPDLAQCSQLTLLALQQNSITGGIPYELGNLAHLDILLLYDNNLTGVIPSSLGNCTEMNDLELSINSLQGGIPAELGQLKKLIWLILFDNSLTGTIPASLGNCSALTDLEMGINSLHGTMLPAFFRFEHLVYLDLDQNNFSGGVPPIGNLSVLLELSLSNNVLQGSLPAEVGKLTELQGLSVAGNHITGTIPDQIANCTKLSILKLSQNSFAGFIPSSFGQLKFLNILDLGQNKLSGQIPHSMANCTGLESMSVGYNKLSGEFPSSLAAIFPSLQIRLDVSHNRLSGPLPQQLGSLILLQILDMSNNAFYDAIPGSISNCASLMELNLAANNLSGPLPSSTADIYSLMYLNLSHNSLSQGLPTQLGSLKNLTQLDLSYNQLTGPLTTESLQNLSHLTYLNVSYNKFTGPIPDGGVFKNFTAYSFVGNVGLCGPVLHRACPTSSSSSKTHLTREAIIGIAFAVFAIFAMLIFGMHIVFRQRRHLVKPPNPSKNIAVLFTLQYRYLTEADIQVATNGFSSNNVIGQGGASTVYRAKMNDGSLLAVKKLLPQEATEKSFLAELESLGAVCHRNLVRIHGYISSAKTRILLLDFMSNGSLDTCLHSTVLKNCNLDWKARLKIIKGIVHGLVYLHHHCSPPIIHCDLKPSNILLDTEMEAHIGDFGLAKLIYPKAAGSDMNVSVSNFQGSFGYMAPECGYSSKVSPKSDVYSYGIILLELLTGKRPTDTMFDGACSLLSWVQSRFPNDVLTVLDTVLITCESPEIDVELEASLHLVMKLALMCTKEHPDERPSMNEVLQLLEITKPSRSFETDTPDSRQLQQTPYKLGGGEGSSSLYWEAANFEA